MIGPHSRLKSSGAELGSQSPHRQQIVCAGSQHTPHLAMDGCLLPPQFAHLTENRETPGSPFDLRQPFESGTETGRIGVVAIIEDRGPPPVPDLRAHGCRPIAGQSGLNPADPHAERCTSGDSGHGICDVMTSGYVEMEAEAMPSSREAHTHG